MRICRKVKYGVYQIQITWAVAYFKQYGTYLGQDKGAEGIILGCTEIGLLIRQEDTDIPLFDTAYIHVCKAALYSLEN